MREYVCLFLCKLLFLTLINSIGFQHIEYARTEDKIFLVKRKIKEEEDLQNVNFYRSASLPRKQALEPFKWEISELPCLLMFFWRNHLFISTNHCCQENSTTLYEYSILFMSFLVNLILL